MLVALTSGCPIMTFLDKSLDCPVMLELFNYDTSIAARLCQFESCLMNLMKFLDGCPAMLKLSNYDIFRLQFVKRTFSSKVVQL